jgi:ABC-2 type transport system ATP-binding protein/lipopolysaccharide transport system ATP-binding protein
MLGAISVENLSKRFVLRHNRSETLKSRFVGLFYKRYREVRENFWALQDVSLSVEPGETFGIIGRNGSGKSTLLKVIAGIYAPSSGSVRRRPGAKIGTMIELGVGFNGELTGIENVFLNASLHGLRQGEIRAMLPEVAAFSELGRFLDTPLKNYSSGMQMRLAFSIMAQMRPDILLIDEVLAVGDASFQQKCLEKLASFKKAGSTILFVSHAQQAVEKFCDRVCVLERGRVACIGTPREALARYSGRALPESPLLEAPPA